MSQTDLLFELKNYILFEQNDIYLKDAGKEFLDKLSKEPFHLYCVLKKPKIKINEDRMGLSNGYFNIPFDIFLENGVKSFDIKLKSENKKNELNGRLYENSKFIELKFGNRMIFNGKASFLLDELNKQNPDLLDELDYEILYIGKAFSDKNPRNAVNRIFNHETVQRIYAETLDLNPNSTIWFMLCEFRYHSSIVPRQSIPLEEALRLFQKSTSIKGDEKYKLIEASLINYFKPRFNDKFTTDFPSPKHQSYSTAYKINLNNIKVEFGITDLGRSIYSGSIPRSQLHIYSQSF